MTKTTYQPGQTLYWVPSTSQKPSEVTIDNVGRKWLYLSNGRRIHIKTLMEDTGFGRPAQCYRSKAEYERILAARVSWAAMRSKVIIQYNAPDGVTTEAIKQAHDLLFPAP